ncbi:hypothetical protein [Streptomyces sp. LaBMicrA B280]|uniref:hypothetical protein n=1 Tax=Streptomyces sp. LaBMicrA B280 TaxID=3391001 RepID=UPI003BA6CF42
MSDVFAMDLALDLSSSVPNALLDDLRWHLGLRDDENDAVDEMAVPEPLLAARGPAARIGGLLTGELVRAGSRWSLTARQEVHAELLPELESLIECLAFHATTDGVIGQIRFYEDDIPEMLLNRSGELVRMNLRPDEPTDH